MREFLLIRQENIRTCRNDIVVIQCGREGGDTITRTITDVARLAGVSIKTVSRVLNGAPGVRPETEQRVQQAMQTLSYSPDPAARSLRSGLKYALGVYIGEHVEHIFANPFFGLVLRGIAHTASQAGFHVMLNYGPQVGERNVDGLILMSISARDPLLYSLTSRGVPIVLTCHHDTGLDLPEVEVDNVRGAMVATQHLINLGHRRIAFLGGSPTLCASRERLAGYRAALESAGIPFDEDLVVSGDYGEESGMLMAPELFRLAVRPTALFAASDMLAIGAMQAALRHNLRIPQDISVVGFDDMALARYLQPPLTTVNQNGYHKGVLAAEILIKLIRKEALNPRKVLLEPELIVRQSAGAFQGGAL